MMNGNSWKFIGIECIHHHFISRLIVSKLVKSNNIHSAVGFIRRLLFHSWKLVFSYILICTKNELFVCVCNLSIKPPWVTRLRSDFIHGKIIRIEIFEVNTVVWAGVSRIRFCERSENKCTPFMIILSGNAWILCTHKECFIFCIKKMYFRKMVNDEKSNWINNH